MNDAIPHALKEAYARHSDHLETAQQLADVSGIDLAVVLWALDDGPASRQLEAYKAKLQAEGKTLPVKAHRALNKAVDAIHEQLDKGVDGFEAVELSKPLIRILENTERVRLAERDKEDGRRAVVHITVVNGTTQVRATLPDVIDVDAKPAAPGLEDA